MFNNWFPEFYTDIVNKHKAHQYTKPDKRSIWCLHRNTDAYKQICAHEAHVYPLRLYMHALYIYIYKKKHI